MSDVAAQPGRAENYTRGLILVAGAGMFWSLGGLFFRLVDDATVWQIVAWRTFFLASSMTLFIAWRYGRGMLAVFRSVLSPWGIVAAVGTATANTLFMWSLEYTYVANTVLMLAAAPVISAVLSWFLLRESVRPATMLAMAGVILGVLVMLSGGLGLSVDFSNGFDISFGERGGNKPDQWIGDLLAVFMVTAFAFIVVAVRAGRNVEMLPCVVLGGAIACIFASG
ncbi:MAG: DMT family transporter, partial [Rhodospirillaceae bacterium]|nr:DMT family transporter [Rhodospirillaceae bacterium]